MDFKRSWCYCLLYPCTVISTFFQSKHQYLYYQPNLCRSFTEIRIKFKVHPFFRSTSSYDARTAWLAKTSSLWISLMAGPSEKGTCAVLCRLRGRHAQQTLSSNRHGTFIIFPRSSFEPSLVWEGGPGRSTCGYGPFLGQKDPKRLRLPRQ